LAVDSIKWLVGKYAPRTYGDKPQDQAPGELKISWQKVERVIVRPDAEIVAESYIDGESVTAVTRRHGLTPQQLFGWRQLDRRKMRRLRQQSPAHM
jgi:hypothetical protein